MTNETPPDIQWRQYEIHIDLYKHYMDLALKFNVFYYAVTGAILSFYFSRSDLSLMRWSLVFPIIMSIAFGGFFFYAAVLAGTSAREVIRLAQHFQLPVFPAIGVLGSLLRIFGGLFFVVAIGLASVLFGQTR